jgi:hypothetical protein
MRAVLMAASSGLAKLFLLKSAHYRVGLSGLSNLVFRNQVRMGWLEAGWFDDESY